mgnify:CR=1 FL=1
MTTQRIHTAKLTRPLQSMKQSFRTADLLDSLKRAWMAAFKLYTSGDLKLVALARMAMYSIRRNAANLFGNNEVAEAFLMGGY